MVCLQLVSHDCISIPVFERFTQWYGKVNEEAVAYVQNHAFFEYACGPGKPCTLLYAYFLLSVVSQYCSVPRQSRLHVEGVQCAASYAENKQLFAGCFGHVHVSKSRHFWSSSKQTVFSLLDGLL